MREHSNSCTKQPLKDNKMTLIYSVYHGHQQTCQQTTTSFFLNHHHPQHPPTMPTHRRHTTATTNHQQPPGHTSTPSERCRNTTSAAGRLMGGDDDDMARQRTSDSDSCVNTPLPPLSLLTGKPGATSLTVTWQPNTKAGHGRLPPPPPCNNCLHTKMTACVQKQHAQMTTTTQV